MVGPQRDSNPCFSLERAGSPRVRTRLSVTLATANCQSSATNRTTVADACCMRVSPGNLWSAPPVPSEPARGRRRDPLLLPRGHDEHPVDLVARGLVLDAVADAPYAPQPPLVEIGGILVDQLLPSGVRPRAPLGVERRAALDDEVVERLVAVV